jgi:23S rRNA (adenine2030-N6)-methyltransferase
MIQKDKPILYVDTHAGAGAYVLSEGYAAINSEWESGIGRLRRFSERKKTPESLAAFEGFIAEYEREFPGGYPGSPAIAARLLRGKDRLHLCELHPADYDELAQRFSSDARTRVRKENGFAAIKALLPPPSRRGLVFMDPSYEIPSDYDDVAESVTEGFRRFSTGTFVVWYPLLDRPEARALPERLLGITDRPRIDVWLRVRNSAPGERGMSGSGMVIINPPWTLGASLGESLPYLALALGQDDSSGWSVRTLPDNNQ